MLGAQDITQRSGRQQMRGMAVKSQEMPFALKVSTILREARRHAIKVRRKQDLVPEVLDVVCGHGRIRYPIVDYSIDSYSY